jgi:hypothetical protein
MENFKELPEFSFNRDAGLTDQERERIASVMRRLTMELPVEQKTISLERLARVDYAISDIAEWLKSRLGLDARKRIPAMDRIKFFSKKEWPKVAEKYRQSPDSRGLNSEINEILMVEDENEEEMYGVLSHELIHCFSRRLINVRNREDGSGRDIGVKLYGFRNLKNNNFNWFNEIMTDTISIEVLSNSDRPESQATLANLTEYYKNGVILLDMIFERMAQKTGKNQSEIRDMLYSAYFDGDMAALKIFKDVFGVQALKLLSLLKDNECPATFLEMIASKYFEIDVDEYKKRVDEFGRGQELLLASGTKIKMAKVQDKEIQAN